MTTLEERRERGNLIQAYKVLTGKEMGTYQAWFQMNTEEVDRRQTRDSGGVLSVQRKEGRLELRKNFWSVRVANTWNLLPDMVKLAATVDSFKNGLDNWTEREKRGERQPTLGAPDKTSSTTANIGSSYMSLM